MKTVLLQTLVSAVTSPAAWLVMKASVIAALALAAAALARRQSAARRHLIFAGAMAALLIVPLASLVAPAARIALPWTASAASATPGVSLPFDDPAWAGDVPPNPDVDIAARTGVAASRGGDVTPFEMACATWACGACIVLLPMLAGLYEVRRLRRAGRPWPEAQAMITDLAREARARRRVRLLLHDAVAGPMTYGVARPVIVMPAEARRWPEAELRRALVHELEHARRWDWLSLCAARLVCGLYWFHPLVWALSRRLELDAERACDDAVLRRADALAYADQLVGFAERWLRNSRPPLLAMASRTHLTARIGAVLDSRQRRGRAGRTGAALAFAVAMLLALAFSPLRIVARGENADAADTQQQAKLSFDVAVVREWKPGQTPRRYRTDVRRVDPIRVWAQYAPLSELVRYAFNLSGSEPVEGLPDWAGPPGADFGSAIKFFVDARMPASTTDAQARRMMQTLLQERFRLAWHWTSKPTKVLELVVGPGGLKLKRADPGRDPKIPNGKIFTCPSGADGCAIFFPHPATMRELAGQVSSLRWLFGRPVLDKTGLNGEFFVPQMTLTGSASASLPSAPMELRDVTGLELRPATDTIPVMVIDRVEKLQGGGASN